MTARERDWLVGILSGEGLGTEPSGNNCEGEDCLVDLAEQVECKMFWSENVDPPIDNLQVTVDNPFWSVRSFLNEEDFYYVYQDFQFTLQNGSSVNNLFTLRLENDPGVAAPPQQPLGGAIPGLIDPSPGTTPLSTTTTSSVTQSISGGVGGGGSGPTLDISASTSVSNTTSKTVPEMEVLNAARFDTGFNKWQYNINSCSATSGTFTNQWIWSMKRSDYASTATALVFATSGELQYRASDASWVNAGFGGLYNIAPFPFDTWEPDAPTIEDISQNGSSVTSVVAGTSFVIEGVGLYPSFVQRHHPNE